MGRTQSSGALRWQEPLAKLIARTPLKIGLAWAVRLLVPRHRVGVAAVAINRQGEVLMLRHVFHPQAPWGLPGGWLNRGEDPANGVMRELAEETGLTGRVGPLVYSGYEPKPPHIGLAYLASVQPGMMTLSNEILEAGWFAPGDLPRPLLPFVRRSIDSALAVANGATVQQSAQGAARGARSDQAPKENPQSG